MRPPTALDFGIAALVISVSLVPGVAQGPEPGKNPAGSPFSSQTAGEVRFPVALQHSGSWCYGYLYTSQERVRFEVVQPQSAKNSSFDAPRAEVTVGKWLILGMPQDAIELKTKSTTYHMRWLANESEIKSGAARRWSPPNSLPPDTLVAAIQNPGAALRQSDNRPPNPEHSLADLRGAAPAENASAGANVVPGASALPLDNQPQNASPGMLAGAYVATAQADGPSNKQFLFYPDGFVRNGVPEEGTLGLDLAHYRAQDNRNRDWVGHYKVEGNTIKIIWGTQNTDWTNPDIFERNENAAHSPHQIGPQIFIPMCHCTGRRLSGLYRWGDPAQDTFIHFNPDGTFTDHRLTDELFAISFERPRIQNGTYQIIDQTIVFSFVDGHRGTRSFLAPKAQKDNPTFDWIDLGWKMLFEESYRARLSRGW